MTMNDKQRTIQSTKGGYNRRSHSEHPGVRIVRLGSHRLVLRYTEPGTRRQVQQALMGRDGLPVASREKAKPFAIAKARELLRERIRIENGGRPVDGITTWAELFAHHQAHLEARNRSSKSITMYAQHWKAFCAWPARPNQPQKLTIASLEGFVRHRRDNSARQKAPLSPHSIASTARHIKAILNYGRRVLACVRLDAEAINSGLAFGKLPRPVPVVLPANDLKSVLDAALEHDANVCHAMQVFPFLAFLMVTGCRRGEAEILRWKPSKPGASESYCDFSGGRIVIWGNKTGRGRPVPLGPRPKLRRLLEVLREQCDLEQEPYVFGGPLPLAIGDKRNEEAPPGVMGRSLKGTLAEVKSDSGVSYALKDFRSTLATYMANSSLGLNLYTLAGELGHDYAVLVKHYAGQVTLSDAQRSSDTVEHLLGITSQMDSWIAWKLNATGPRLRLVDETNRTAMPQAQELKRF